MDPKELVFGKSTQLETEAAAKTYNNMSKQRMQHIIENISNMDHASQYGRPLNVKEYNKLQKELEELKKHYIS